jgi:hypothetical protein
VTEAVRNTQQSLDVPIVERLRSYYVIEGGKPWFSNKTKVHKAVDLHEAVETIERLRLLLSCAQTYVKMAAENGKSTIAEELFFDIKDALAKIGGEA